MTSKKNEVAKTTKQEVSTDVGAVPDFMKQYAGQGVENIATSDVEIPRLLLLQSLSTEVTEGDEKAGVFYHSILEEALDKELKIIPIYVDIRYILWKPRHDGGGILARADDGEHWHPSNAQFTVKPVKGLDKTVVWETKPTVTESGLDKWGSSDPSNPNSQPAATKMFNIVAYLPDHPELSPCVITLQRGAVKSAKKFMGKLKISGLPSYGQVFNMSSIKTDTGSGDYYDYRFEKVGHVQDEALFGEMKKMYEQFKEMGIQIKDLESIQDDEGGEADVKTAIDI